ncbi:MAG: hypothetical protein R3F11_11465 [Verrucomicrobiales bacterium]
MPRCLRPLCACLAAGVVFFAGLPSLTAASLVHSWRFEGDLSDSSPSGNAGALSAGTADYVTGRFGQGISLGAAQSVSSTAVSNLPAGAADPWSLNVWAKVASTARLGYLATGADPPSAAWV